MGHQVEASIAPRLYDRAMENGSGGRYIAQEGKGLTTEWIRSLFERGEEPWVRAEEARTLGMPVGGCFAGTVYLGADGRLWNWDVFNQHHLGAVIRREEVRFRGESLDEIRGANYVRPPEPFSPFALGFWVESHQGRRTLDSEGGWDSIRFLGRYPIGTVVYESSDLEVRLDAFSPFVPLRIEDSSFPAVVMAFRVRNRSREENEIQVACEFENPCLLYSRRDHPEARVESEYYTEATYCGVRHFSHPDSLRDLPDFGTFVATYTGAPPALFLPLRDRNAIAVPRRLAPGEEAEMRFVVAWHFPNCSIPGMEGRRRWYASRWSDAREVADDLISRLPELESLTRKWVDVWYDRSTLPWYVLQRTFASLSTLATNTCYRFEDGRYWFWEGVGCCPGTCTHVWGYAQGIARVFPEVEATLREQVDFGLSFHDDTGAIDYRGEFDRTVAHDGQCNCILRVYREHTMQRDGAFLRRLYPRVKKAMQYLMREDADGDGLLEGRQYNTLDADWYGPMAWISSLYLGALRACEQMATEMGDAEFAEACAQRISAGSRSMVERLFNGEYFIHEPDPDHPEANASGKGCLADQLFGESYLRQLCLSRVVPERETRMALRSIFRYNYAPDVGPYREQMQEVKGGRWYAMPGEGGLLLCTFPRGGADRATGEGPTAWAAQYFNEVWTGIEYQVASHMIAEGMVQEGLTILKTVHERYSPSKRNPYNEIECSDHYGRALAAFGVYVSLIGMRHHGPSGELAFHPALPGEQRFAFVAADGWGIATVGEGGSAELEYVYRVESP